MTRACVVFLVMITIAGPAAAFGLGKQGMIFSRLGLTGKPAKPVIQPTGSILLVDGVSLILQVDAASQICRAGGC